MQKNALKYFKHIEEYVFIQKIIIRKTFVNLVKI